MQDNFNNIRKHDECISEKMMLKYLDGSLSPVEQNRVERHLLDCEICSDAIAGLQTQNAQQLKDALGELDQRINKRIHSAKESTSPKQWIYRIAAVLVFFLLFAGGFYYLQSVKKSEKVFTENFEPYRDTIQGSAPVVTTSPEEKETRTMKEEVSPSPNKAEQRIAFKDKNAGSAKTGSTNQEVEAMNKNNDRADEEASKKITAAESVKEKKDADVLSSDEKAIVPAAVPEKPVNTIQADESKTFNERSKNQLSKPAMQEISSTAKTTRENAADNKLSESSEYDISTATGKLGNAFADSLVKEGIRQYEAKNYSAAISIFNTALKNDRENPEALFYNGVSNLSVNEEVVAINLLESVLKNSQNKFSDAAKWYLSLAYIKKNKIPKAKKLLEELSNSNNEYKINARKTLEELK